MCFVKQLAQGKHTQTEDDLPRNTGHKGLHNRNTNKQEHWGWRKQPRGQVGKEKIQKRYRFFYNAVEIFDCVMRGEGSH